MKARLENAITASEFSCWKVTDPGSMGQGAQNAKRINRKAWADFAARPESRADQ
jgi:hypothetical protein